MPQEEEEETVSEVEETSLLARGEWSAIMVAKKWCFLFVIMLFLSSSLWDCSSVASLQSKSSSMLWFGVIWQCCHLMAAEQTETILLIFEVLTNEGAIFISAD